MGAGGKYCPTLIAHLLMRVLGACHPPSILRTRSRIAGVIG